MNRRSALKVGAVLALACPALPARAQPHEIVIGAPNATTGGFGEAGRRVVTGLQVAVDEINRAGGIKSMGGAQLKLDPVDTSDNPTQAASVTQRLISQDHARVLVGANTSAMTLSVQIEAEKAQIPLLTTSYADAVVQRGMKYTFKIPPQASALTDISMQYITGLIKDQTAAAPKTVAVFAGSDSSSQALLGAVPTTAGKYGLSVVASVSFPTGLTDTTPIISAALRSRPDVIFLSSFSADVILVTKALRAAHIRAPIITAAGGIATDTTGTALGAAAENLMGVDCWNWDLPGDSTKPILDGYKALEPNSPFPPASETLGTGYAIGRMIGQALETAGTDDPIKLRDVIAGMQGIVPLPGGKVVFDASGQNTVIVPLLVGWQDGQLRTMWPKEYQTVKPRLGGTP